VYGKWATVSETLTCRTQSWAVFEILVFEKRILNTFSI